MSHHKVPGTRLAFAQHALSNTIDYFLRQYPLKSHQEIEKAIRAAATRPSLIIRFLKK